MRMSVVRHPPDEGGRGALTIRAAGPHSALVHGTDLRVGVQVCVDVLRPDRWTGMSVDATSGGVFAALSGAVDDGGEIEVATDGLWLRVAIIDALDRWLQIPVDQAVVDAERAVALESAAAVLHDEASREILLGEALRTARRASSGLVTQLRKLDGAAPVPARLRDGIEHLVAGYGRMVRLVAGPDRALAAVPAAWRTLQASGGAGLRAGRRRRARRTVPCCRNESSLIDPRQVPARLLALSTDPMAGEVQVEPTTDGAGIRIEVPAFDAAVDAETAARLQVRLIDRGSSRTVRHGQLTLTGSRPAARRFQCVIPANGLDVSRLRADVYDARSDVPPAAADTDDELRTARRASLFLSEWRHLVAAAQVARTTGISHGVQTLAERLERWAGGPTAQAFPSGPSPSDLFALVGASDAATRRRLLAASDGAVDGALGSTAGPGRLLVAETWLVAERSG
jgi:hypothetical protein